MLLVGRLPQEYFEIVFPSLVTRMFFFSSSFFPLPGYQTDFHREADAIGMVVRKKKSHKKKFWRWNMKKRSCWKMVVKVALVEMVSIQVH